ncbi:MAG: TolC family protein, partial [Phaeodactylibacter sp.]|nr:TolC family protein [Phaeodactylibacter sp.]
LVSTQQDIKNRVKESYMPALIIQESVKTLDRNIGNVETLLKETKALYKEGFVEQLDVDRLELSLANLKTEQENLQRQEEMAT